MNTISCTAIRRGTQLVAVLILVACTAASCRSEKPAARDHCAFADPEMMTSLGICNIAAEYYVAHHEWPLSTDQIEEQGGKTWKLVSRFPNRYG
jgi:hypothetical protein